MAPVSAKAIANKKWSDRIITVQQCEITAPYYAVLKVVN